MEHNSYKICVSKKKNGDSLNTIYKLKKDEQINLPKSTLKANEEDIERILELFKIFKKNQSIDIIIKKYKDLYNSKAFRHFSEGYSYFDKHYTEISHFRK